MNRSSMWNRLRITISSMCLRTMPTDCGLSTFYHKDRDGLVQMGPDLGF